MSNATRRRYSSTGTIAIMGGGFTTVPPRTIELGAIQSKVSGVQKPGADGTAEAIYLIRTMPKAARPSVQGGIEIRMVRQLLQARC